MRYAIIGSLALLGLFAGAPGCGDDGDDDDTSADGDTDTDTDSDADSDGDTDTNPWSCGGLPVTCDDIGSGWDELTYGCCWDNTVYWCGIVDQEWVMQSQDCDEIDKTCADSPEDGYVWCVD